MNTKMGLYVILDRIAESTGPIFEAVNVGVARRKFRDLIDKQVSNPEEYKLLCLGEVDHQGAGRIYPNEIPVDVTIQVVSEEVARNE